MIFLFTDFGSADIYVGQVRAALAVAAPGVAVIDLLNDAPRFDIACSAHLLAALAQRLPPGSVTLAVVDPGVGTDRKPVVVRCDERWFVGPDNGLLSVLAARCPTPAFWEIRWRPATLSRSFHGRDLFAPIAARIAASGLPGGDLEVRPTLDVQLGGEESWQVIYVDHYGNVVTGICGGAVDASAILELRGESIGHAGIFAEARDERAFWYVNSIGLVEIACNGASAANRLTVEVGDSVSRRKVSD